MTTKRDGLYAPTGAMYVTSGICNTGVLSSCAATNAATVVLAANASRQGAMVFNSTAVTIFLSLNTTVPTTAAFTTAIAAGAYYEVPFGYQGSINCIAASSAGVVLITELT